MNDSVAQLASAWQAICQFAGSSPSLSHSPLFFHIFISHLSFLMTLTRLRSDCKSGASLQLSLCLVLHARHTSELVIVSAIV